MKKHKKITPNKNFKYYVLAILLISSISIVFFIIKPASTKCNIKLKDICISDEELNSRVSLKERFFEASSQKIDKDNLKILASEELRDEKILSNYAKQKGIKVNNEELMTLYQQRVSLLGGEDKLLKSLDKMYGLNKTDYLKQLEKDIEKDKIQKTLDKPISDWLISQK